MLTLTLQKLRYPDWYDISKGDDAQTQDEEKYIDLRSDVTIFIENLIKNQSHFNLTTSFLDNLIQTLQSLPGQNEEITRTLNQVLKIIQILMSSRHRSVHDIVNKYGFVVFNERLLQSDCQSYSDLILDIYQKLNLQELQ